MSILRKTERTPSSTTAMDWLSGNDAVGGNGSMSKMVSLRPVLDFQIERVSVKFHRVLN